MLFPLAALVLKYLYFPLNSIITATWFHGLTLNIYSFILRDLYRTSHRDSWSLLCTATISLLPCLIGYYFNHAELWFLLSQISGIMLTSSGSSCLPCSWEIVSLESWVIMGITSWVSFFSKIIVMCCLLSSAWKNCLTWFVWIYSCFFSGGPI